jgi:squalene synthase HpnC
VVADDQAAAYAYCLQLAREHYENFPVASRLLPSAMRPHVAAVYAFARKADDFADEPGLQPERYETWPDVLDYCRRSANPVGRLVLQIAGYRGIELDRQSDAICTALQLTNFWQDLERDWRIGRIYAPRVDRERCGARETDLEARRLTSEWRQLMSELVTRTRALFDEGRPLMDALRGRLKWELRLTWLGGVRILDRLEAVGYDVFRSRPTLRSGDVPALAWQAVRWRRGA